jgi:hypothetical protein
LRLNRIVFAFLAVFAWFPVLLLLFLFISGLVHFNVPVPSLARLRALTSNDYWYFGMLYSVVSGPVVLLLAWVRPRSRFLSYLLVLPFSVIIPLIVTIVLLPTVYWGIYAVLFVVITWNLGPIMWSIAVAELRWRVAESERKLPSP